MSNALHWLRDKLPTGMNRIDGINSLADKFWKGYLENIGQSDNVYMHLKVPENI